MSVRRRGWRDPATNAQKEAWMVDIDFTAPDGTTKRIRKVSPVPTRRGAEEYERKVRAALLDGSYFAKEATPVRTLAEFFPQFIDGHAKAEHLSPTEKARTISLLDGAPPEPAHGTTAAQETATNKNSAS